MAEAPSGRLLFGSEVLPAVLHLLLTHPRRQYGWTEIREALAGANPDSLRRALERGQALGVVRRYPKGGRYGTYSADISSPLYSDLRRLLLKVDLRPRPGVYQAMDICGLAGVLKEGEEAADGRLPEAALTWIHQFLDDFRSSSRESQRRLISAAPDHTGSPLWDSYLASLAEYLAAEASLPAPMWVNEPERFLRTWWIEADLPSSRPAALALSPAAFRRHGIFISDRALARA